MAKLTDSYNLQKINPKLSSEWHPTKNGNLTPWGITPVSSRKVWWHCKNKHEWQAKIASRANGHNCPYCSGRAAGQDNCLQTINPRLASEWHPTKNGKLTPKDITPGRNKKVWWQCRKGHEWQALVKSRAKGTGCPFCIGLYVSRENNLQVHYTKLTEEWHPVKNGDLTPKDVLPYFKEKVWWQCQNGHEWQTRVINRTKNKSGCPYCAGKLPSKDRNLKVLNPKLAKEWHPVKNNDLTPESILPGAHTKVWWQCSKGHEWQAFVFARNKNNGTGCPYCIR